MGGGESKQPVSAMAVGGSEVVEDDDMSVVSDGGGDDEVNSNENV